MTEKKCNESEQEGAQSATEDALSDAESCSQCLLPLKDCRCGKGPASDVEGHEHMAGPQYGVPLVECYERVMRHVKSLPVPDHWHCVRCGMAQPGVESMRTLRRGASIRHGPWKFAGTCRLCLGVERAAREAQSAEEQP